MLSQLSCEELVELGIEYSICDELHAGTKDLLRGNILPSQRASTAAPGHSLLMQSQLLHRLRNGLLTFLFLLMFVVMLGQAHSTRCASYAFRA